MTKRQDALRTRSGSRWSQHAGRGCAEATSSDRQSINCREWRRPYSVGSSSTDAPAGGSSVAAAEARCDGGCSCPSCPSWFSTSPRVLLSGSVWVKLPVTALSPLPIFFWKEVTSLAPPCAAPPSIPSAGTMEAGLSSESVKRAKPSTTQQTSVMMSIRPVMMVMMMSCVRRPYFLSVARVSLTWSEPTTASFIFISAMVAKKA
mmetsp:Transcript_50810/g.168302  ORF Transcript_50810/g.168302 Transcript_50810/m.168302 type:complete len:204 (-) Transcript_50810:400-1011(-)